FLMASSSRYNRVCPDRCRTWVARRSASGGGDMMASVPSGLMRGCHQGSCVVSPMHHPYHGAPLRSLLRPATAQGQEQVHLQGAQLCIHGNASTACVDGVEFGLQYVEVVQLPCFEAQLCEACGFAAELVGLGQCGLALQGVAVAAQRGFGFAQGFQPGAFEVGQGSIYRGFSLTDTQHVGGKVREGPAQAKAVVPYFGRALEQIAKGLRGGTEAATEVDAREV